MRISIVIALLFAVSAQAADWGYGYPDPGNPSDYYMIELQEQHEQESQHWRDVEINDRLHRQELDNINLEYRLRQLELRR